MVLCDLCTGCVSSSERFYQLPKHPELQFSTASQSIANEPMSLQHEKFNNSCASKHRWLLIHFPAVTIKAVKLPNQKVPMVPQSQEACSVLVKKLHQNGTQGLPVAVQENHCRWLWLNLAQHKLIAHGQAEGWKDYFFQNIRVALLNVYFSITSSDLQEILMNFVLDWI